jgi:hypothetical protein
MFGSAVIQHRGLLHEAFRRIDAVSRLLARYFMFARVPSPRANVALSILDSLEWLRTKLQALFSRSIAVSGKFPRIA